MLVSASEDVGLADPQALGMVIAAAEAFRRVGLPEGQFHLAQAALYLATAPKSNSTLGYFDALKVLENEEAHAVPPHLKDASRDAQAFGHGKNYQYPHAFKDHWVNQQYLPGGMASQVFYHPSDQGYEGRIRGTVLEHRELVLGTPLNEENSETLTWADEKLTPWAKRLDREDAGPLMGLRQIVFDEARLRRHHLVWVASDTHGFLLFEALRRSPEGRVWASLPDATQLRSIAEYLSFIPEFEQPVWGDQGWGVLPVPDGQVPSLDRILAWGPLLPESWVPPSGNARLVIVDPANRSGSRLTDWLSEDVLGAVLLKTLKEAEEDFLSRDERRSLRQAWNLTERLWASETTRSLSREEWEAWWTPGKRGRWSDFLLSRDPSWAEHLSRLKGSWPGPRISWKRAWTIWSGPEEIL
jgi:hypothetical protein